MKIFLQKKEEKGVERQEVRKLKWRRRNAENGEMRMGGRTSEVCDGKRKITMRRKREVKCP